MARVRAQEAAVARDAQRVRAEHRARDPSAVRSKARVIAVLGGRDGGRGQGVGAVAIGRGVDDAVAGGAPDADVVRLQGRVGARLDGVVEQDRDVMTARAEARLVRPLLLHEVFKARQIQVVRHRRERVHRVPPLRRDLPMALGARVIRVERFRVERLAGLELGERGLEGGALERDPGRLRGGLLGLLWSRQLRLGRRR